MAENAPYNKESLLVPVPVRRPIKSQHINIAINEQKATNDHAVMLAWRAGRQTTWWSEVPKQDTRSRSTRETDRKTIEPNNHCTSDGHHPSGSCVDIDNNHPLGHPPPP